jgi:hypothetical protein
VSNGIRYPNNPAVSLGACERLCERLSLQLCSTMITIIIMIIFTSISWFPIPLPLGHCREPEPTLDGPCFTTGLLDQNF